jgi:glycosidase
MNAAKSDTSKFRLVLTFLLTIRGIPQIYYGTEIAMIGGRSHGELREEFPGGFPDHKRSAFNSEGRTQLENNIYTFIKNLVHLRKEHTAFSNGSLIQFPPKDELYVYFRIDDSEKILVVINNNDDENRINLDSFQNIICGEPDTLTILSGNENIKLNNQIIKVKPKSAGIILIK